MITSLKTSRRKLWCKCTEARCRKVEHTEIVMPLRRKEWKCRNRFLQLHALPTHITSPFAPFTCFLTSCSCSKQNHMIQRKEWTIISKHPTVTPVLTPATSKGHSHYFQVHNCQLNQCKSAEKVYNVKWENFLKRTTHLKDRCQPICW
jgi:hypothetical protein